MPFPQLEITVKYRCTGKRTTTPIINNCGDAFNVINKICNKNEILWREELLMLCLNTANKLQGWYRVSSGANDSVQMDLRVIATIAAQSAASYIILAHNHPCGGLTPSMEDIKSTKTIMKGLQLIGTELIDHIIFTDKDYMSMKESGYIQ